jgi:cobalt-zinc-cadmium efflux system membrane fusion protein
MVTVRARVDNPDRRLKAEMFVTVEFSVEAPPGVEVPIKAVFMKSERHFVYIEEQPGAYARREVELGAEHDGKIVVSRGLTVGQRVVTEGGLLLDEVRADAGGS